MKNKFDAPEDLPQTPDIFHNPDPRLSPRQAEIYRNLKTIGPEIAAFYCSGVKMLNNKDLGTSSYHLAQIAREIEGGLRDVLSQKQEKQRIQKQLQKTDMGNLSDRIGHIASILAALNIDDLSDPLAQRWISVATQFHKFAHRHGPWESPREKEAFVPLWNEFENVLVELVGTYFKLLDRIDRILGYEKPTEEIIKTLPNLLKFRVRRNYFFNNLDSPAWLKPLQDAGWFHPDKQPISQEVTDQHFWHALGYVEKVADNTKEAPCEETFNILADIVNTIVDYTHDTGASIASDHTDWRIIKIICTLPIERIESRHITFIGVALKSRTGTTLVSSVIAETFLPKLLNGKVKDLTLQLLEEMLYAEVIHHNIRSVMEGYWLWDALDKHEKAITELCGIEVVQIARARIRSLIDEGAYSFNVIRKIESDLSDYPYRYYAELLVGFTANLLRSVEFDYSIEKIVKDLLQEGLAVTWNDPIKKEALAIFGRIAFDAIIHHYEDLKHLFWEWDGNPLEEYYLKPSIYQLIETCCSTFDTREFDLILHWIESYHDSEDWKDNKTKALEKREWLSALMETGNEKAVSAYQKYEQINPLKIERPGLSLDTEISSDETDPVTVEVLANMSNTQIAELLNNSEKEVERPDWVKNDLTETLVKCIETNPEQFTDNLLPFQEIRNVYQYWVLEGFLSAWRGEKAFDWEALLKFIYHIITSKQFKTNEHKTGLNYQDWILSATAELIKAGTADDEYAFDVQLLPLAEKILFVLVEQVKSDRTAISDASVTVLNSTPEKVFAAMVNYALQFARLHDVKQSNVRWPQTIKADFSKRLDRSFEPSFEFSFTLGAYLPNLLYLDKEWVVGNINRIFPQQDEYHWQAAFSGYLYNSRIYADIYSLLKEHGHYQKALNTDFSDNEIPRGLVEHICTGWIEDSETLNDKTSLIYQLINGDNPNLLSHFVHFFWRQRDSLPEKMKAKVRPTWLALYESLSQKDDIQKYEEVLSKLSGWVALVDTIDTEVLKWLKMSTQHMKGLTDSAFFVEDLLPHVTKTPAEVGDIFLGMLKHNVYPYHDQEYIQGIVRVLYNMEHKEVADRICNLYGAAGFDFLRSLYDENQN